MLIDQLGTRNSLEVFAASANHTVTFQVPALAAAGTYQIQASQVQGSASVGVVSPLALNPGVLQLIVSPAGQNPSPLATFTGNTPSCLKDRQTARREFQTASRQQVL